MCLVALAIDQSRRFPLVIAANRDEFFDRPTARLGWWSPGTGLPDVLSGRDLQAGGTWFGLTAAGRLALVTNVRDPSSVDPAAPSRGEIVPLWLRGDMSADRFWTRVATSGYNGVNLVAADFFRGECFHASNRDGVASRLERGVHGLSNAGLDTPWPKVVALKARLAEGLEDAADADDLARLLFEALADDTQVPDDELPATGVPIEWERQLSPAFIRTPDQRYGTRSSTVVVTERVGRRLVTHVDERSFAVGSGFALLRHCRLEDWPPRYAAGDAPPPSAQQAVTESTAPLAEPGPRSRVRGLLKPQRPRRATGRR